MKERNRRYSACTRKSGGRVSPTCTTCQLDKKFGPTIQREQFSRFPDTVIVAIVSNDVTLARESLGYEAS